MKKLPDLLPLLLYGAAIIGFCCLQFFLFTSSFEQPIPHEHSFTLPTEDDVMQLELNAATAAQLAKLPGMSRPLAEEIVAYRAQIGGFTSIEQLKEIAGIPDALLQSLGAHLYLQPAAAVIETAASTEPIEFPLNLNTATAEELCQLPEIGEVLAAAIVEFRRTNGDFVNKQQLLSVPGIGETTLSGIEAYLYIENEQPLPTEAPFTEPVTNIPATEPPLPEPTEPITEPMTSEPSIINLNTATAEDLLTLPGCDAALAESIIYLRERIHGFQSIFEILYAEGMTKENYLKWEKYLAVDDEGNIQIEKPASY